MLKVTNRITTEKNLFLTSEALTETIFRACVDVLLGERNDLPRLDLANNGVVVVEHVEDRVVGRQQATVGGVERQDRLHLGHRFKARGSFVREPSDRPVPDRRRDY